jgi:plasmid stabilization system protein ParE
VTQEAFLRSEAREDLKAAAQWYEQRHDGLGAEFIDEFLAFITRIESDPQIFPVVEEPIRRGLVRRFPYAVYYSIEPDHLQVLAVMHCSQHPDTWRSRA